MACLEGKLIVHTCTDDDGFANFCLCKWQYSIGLSEKIKGWQCVPSHSTSVICYPWWTKTGTARSKISNLRLQEKEKPTVLGVSYPTLPAWLIQLISSRNNRNAPIHTNKTQPKHRLLRAWEEKFTLLFLRSQELWGGKSTCDKHSRPSDLSRGGSIIGTITTPTPPQKRYC